MVKERFYKTEVVPRCLTFKQPAGTSRGVYTTRKLWEVRIRKEDEPSVIGIGECAPLPDLSCDYGVDYEITLSKACLDLEHEGYVDTDFFTSEPNTPGCGKVCPSICPIHAAGRSADITTSGTF